MNCTCRARVDEMHRPHCDVARHTAAEFERIRAEIKSTMDERIAPSRGIVNGVLFALALIAGITGLWWFLDYLIDR